MLGPSEVPGVHGSSPSSPSENACGHSSHGYGFVVAITRIVREVRRGDDEHPDYTIRGAVDWVKLGLNSETNNQAPVVPAWLRAGVTDTPGDGAGVGMPSPCQRVPATYPTTDPPLNSA